MLKFAEYLKEAKGSDTAFSGHSNEHFTHALVNKYANHIQGLIKSGANYDTAHKSGLDHITKQKYDEKEYSNNPELKNATEHMGHDEMNNMHEDAKKSAIAIVNHIKNNYGNYISGSTHVGKGGEKAVENLTGKKSEGDLVIHTKNKNGNSDDANAILEHLGASLKYSKKKASTIKIHSPTIGNMAAIIDNHHEMMHGHSSSLNDTLHSIGSEGVAAQRAALAPYHDVLSNYFGQLNDKKLTYKPFIEGNQITGGDLSKDAVSHIRDSKDSTLKAAYKAMSVENLKMKNKMAEALHNSVSSVLDHKPGDKTATSIKESLLRSIGNLKTDKLPTFLISTERSKPEASVYDTGQFMTKDLETNGTDRHQYKGKSIFSAGPMSISLDTRPTTNRNPVTSYPINTTIKTSDIKKQGPADVTPKAAEVAKGKKTLSAEAPPTPMQIAAQRQQATATSSKEQPVQQNWNKRSSPGINNRSGITSSNSMWGKQVHADHERNV